MRKGVVFLFLMADLCAGGAIVASCDDEGSSRGADAGASPYDAAAKDDAGDASTEVFAPLTNCLDRPGELARRPSGGLPCELIPPGLSL